jgi:hypothetical protein
MLCDRLKPYTAKELTEDDVRAMMKDLSAQVDLAERAYQDAQRWHTPRRRYTPAPVQ